MEMLCLFCAIVVLNSVFKTSIGEMVSEPSMYVGSNVSVDGHAMSVLRNSCTSVCQESIGEMVGGPFMHVSGNVSVDGPAMSVLRDSCTSVCQKSIGDKVSGPSTYENSNVPVGTTMSVMRNSCTSVCQSPTGTWEVSTSCNKLDIPNKTLSRQFLRDICNSRAYTKKLDRYAFKLSSVHEEEINVILDENKPGTSNVSVGGSNKTTGIHS